MDDVGIIVTKSKNDATKSLKQLVSEAMEKVAVYTNSNRLQLNQDKSLIMVVSKNEKLKTDFEIELGGKVVKHKTSIKILGNIVSDDLSWNQHVKSELIPSLQNRARTLRIIGKFMDPKFRALYGQAIFKSKMIFGAESWGGAQQTLLTKVQSIQNRVVKNILGKEHYNKSLRQKHLILNWLSVKAEIEQSTHKLTHKILNENIPEEISARMSMNTKSLRIGLHRKLDTKPKWLNKNKTTRASYRSRAYKYNTLPEKITSQIKKKTFKKELRNFLREKWTI